jgi:hypothetical protein
MLAGKNRKKKKMKVKKKIINRDSQVGTIDDQQEMT